MSVRLQEVGQRRLRPPGALAMAASSVGRACGSGAQQRARRAPTRPVGREHDEGDEEQAELEQPVLR